MTLDGLGQISDAVEFFIPGEPIPQGSKTGFVVKGRAVVTDANSKVLKPWRQRVALYADRGVTFLCPVRVEVDFFFAAPLRPKFERPAVKPDVDKLARAVLDGLTDGGLIADDARVVSLVARKFYAQKVGAQVRVSEEIDGGN